MFFLRITPCNAISLNGRFGKSAEGNIMLTDMIKKKAGYKAKAVVSAIALMAASSAAVAGQQGLDLDIKSQRTDAALLQLGQAAGVQIMFAPEIAQGTNSPALAGIHTVDEALERLLSSTDLGFRVVSDKLIVVKKKSDLHAALSDDANGMAGDANDAGKDNGFVLEEIIVTATKRSSRLQDVPISISAVGSTTIKETGAQSLQDIAGLVPNFSFPTSRQAGEADIAIRGIFNNVEIDQIGFDVGYGVYLDGVFLGRPNAANAELGDIERVEVLKGPQGTLFGKNTIAGAINIVSKKPGNEFEGKVDVDAGNWNYFRVRGSVNIPLVDEKLAMRLSMNKAQRDGYVTNLTLNDDDIGSYEQFSGRLQIAYTPTDRTSVHLSLDGQSYEGKPYAFDNIGGSAAEIGRDDVKYTEHADGASRSDSDGFGGSLLIEHEFDNAYILTSVTGYRDSSLFSVFDTEHTLLDGHVFQIDQSQKQFTQELRITSPSDNWYDYVAGVYYHRQNNDQDQETFFGPSFYGPGMLANLHLVDNESYAAFVHSNIQLGHGFTLFGGLRFTHETKSFERIDETTPDGFLGRGNGPFIVPTDKIKDEDISWTAGLRYTINDDMMAYASVSTGFKSGGFNVSVRGSQVYDNLIVEPETVTAYELGMKTSWLDKRLTANIAAFYMKYKDLQVSVWDPFAGTTGGFVFRNAAAMTSQGMELELSFRPTDELSFMAGVGYTDSTFDEFPGVQLPRGIGAPGDENDGILDGRTNVAGQATPLAAKWNINASGVYEVPLSNGGAFVTRLDYVYTSGRYADRGFTNDDILPAQYLLNGRIGYRSPDDAWGIYLWGKNLTNQQKPEESRFFNFFRGRLIKRYMEPRTYGVNMNYTF